uniref:t-SNARE coiled-coil homology domain-containing protein n=1 Tax=Polytomella parva TaxID=51329 RepID=A0A6U0UWP2_9CHLO|mmetsp:Transcript_21501/g.38421  ORF Transcript_21501/g.38421 Transcript_21501/m.38421 type:complete len:272 (+) Transcript_21501:195-1010(+)|eukprot:CAMPEP_0175071920 /NCGR_PEP_ID=MMETSP0052_2-20121109/19558_1 /TAXON_ID=51329 ORGANISM="Polytomella parva, Strain SAG 63-3" /NCGR_SAMPLE_ID=MMETSP0052_2 /ASSEMBLY_ACC=CAM_ASM_000194 /LENGTH=271 /DNA_ID=CAMNT_0016339239 /DNA_START=190 /DNA_END=1005 /DNA_ORIENTATION=-
MSLYDVISRAQHVLNKYEKYDAPLKKKGNKDTDPFTEEYEEIEAEIEKLLEASSDVALEQNRALVAAKNAEIRRAKNVLLNEAIQSLEKKAKKGKGVSKGLIEQRQEKIKVLVDRIYDVPDGMSLQANKRPTRQLGGKNNKGAAIILDNNTKKANVREGQYDHTSATQAFEKEWDVAKQRQDKRLEIIEQGVDELGEMAKSMGEELDRQAPVINDIEAQMDKVSHGLKTNNAKLKGMLESMRSSRNFCVDIVLISILLAIGGYLWATFGNK